MGRTKDEIAAYHEGALAMIETFESAIVNNIRMESYTLVELLELIDGSKKMLHEHAAEQGVSIMGGPWHG